MKLVNCNYRGKLKRQEFLEKYGKDIEIYKGRPTMLKYKNSGGTILVFSSGKFRAMGRHMTEQWVYDLKITIYEILMQSMTLTHDLCFPINIAILETCYRQMYEPEFFTSKLIYHSNGVTLNVFGSGMVVLLGVRSLDKAMTAISDVSKYIFK